MALGSAQSTNFQIGAAELRIGSLSNAGKLTQADSVGLLQNASVNYSQQMAELKGGLPLQVIDSVVTEEAITVTASAYEFTRKNINAMVGNGVAATTTANFSFSAKAVVNTGSTTSTLVIGSLEVFGTSSVAVPTSTTAPDLFKVGGLYGVYVKDKPEELKIIRIGTPTTATGTGATLAITLSLDSTLGVNLNAGTYGIAASATPATPVTDIVIYNLEPISVGGNSNTNYITLDIISKNHTTNLVHGYRFWKAAIQGGLDFSFSNDNYATMPITFKILQPAASEVASSGKLLHMANVISTHPTGFYWSGQLD